MYVYHIPLCPHGCCYEHGEGKTLAALVKDAHRQQHKIRPSDVYVQKDLTPTQVTTLLNLLEKQRKKRKSK